GSRERTRKIRPNCLAMVEDTTVLSILRHGVWSALTGGWYYDVNRSDFGNIFHLYLWLIFLLFPFIVHLTVNSLGLAILVYSAPVAFIFLLMKLLLLLVLRIPRQPKLATVSNQELAMWTISSCREIRIDNGSQQQSASANSNADSQAAAAATNSNANVDASSSSFHRIATDPILECSELEERSGSSNQRPIAQQQQRLQRPRNRHGIDRSLSARKATPASQLPNQQHQQANSSADPFQRSRNGSQRHRDSLRRYSSSQQQQQQSSQASSDGAPPPPPTRRVTGPGVGRSQSLRAAAVAAAAGRRAAAAAAAASAATTTSSTATSASNNVSASTVATAVVHCRRSYSLREHLPSAPAVTAETLPLPLPTARTPPQAPPPSSTTAVDRSEKSSTSTVSLHSWIFHSSGTDASETLTAGHSRASVRLKQQPSTAEERAQLLPTGATACVDSGDDLTDVPEANAADADDRRSRKSNSEDDTATNEHGEQHRVSDSDEAPSQKRASSASVAPNVRQRLAATRRRRLPSHQQRVGASGRDDSMPSTSAAAAASSDAASAQDSSASAAPPWTVHVAESYDDTSVGAVHYYHDEAGNLMSYTFGGEQSIVQRHQPLHHPDPDIVQASSSGSGAAAAVSTGAGAAAQLSLDPIQELELRAFGTYNRTGLQAEVPDFFAFSSQPTIEAGGGNDNNHPHHRYRDRSSERRTKVDYRFRLLPCIKSTVRVRFNRLQLRSLLDPFVTLDSVLSILAAILVCIIGTYVLHLGLYRDIWALIYCFTMATAHFSLVHAVEPDPSSPTHGLNRVMAFSRAFYFCLCSAMLIGFRETAVAASAMTENGPSVYSLQPTSATFWLSAYRIWSGFVSALPLVFLFGLLPQPDTFVTYACEQVETHLFGGNSVTGIVSGVYVIVRGLLVWLCLTLLALMAFASHSEAAMSVFAGALLAISYHLGRAPADPSHLISALCRCWPCSTGQQQTEDATSSRQNQNQDQQAPPSPVDDVEGCRRRQSAATEDCPERAAARSSTLVESGVLSGAANNAVDTTDPLPAEMTASMQARLANNAIICALVAILAFAAHVSTVFKALQPALHPVLLLVELVVGLLLHYLLPRLRQEYPWMLFRRPLLRPSEQQTSLNGDPSNGQQPPSKPAKYELAALYLSVVERGILLPAICLSACTMSAQPLTVKFGRLPAAILLGLCALKMTRSVFSASPRQYLVHAFTYLLFNYDYAGCSETYLIDYLLVSFLYAKGVEFSQRVNFVYVYLAPWQVSWGDPFHVLAQAFWIPHSVFMLIQIAISTVFSTPLQPFFGSAIFLTSYVRPVKFWEKNYNTKRADASTTGMIAQVERLSGSDANNLNCLYYEHLARSLQRSLAGDIAFGRWGHVLPGDFYILTSPVDDLNALVHIVEVGNGVVTFQLRGLEFKGTYCQQREVEAIRVAFEEESEKCPCCTMKHLPGLLPMRQAFIGRWYTWYRMGEPYVLESYSRSQNSLSIVLNMGGHDLRRHMIRLYIKCVIFYAARSSRLRGWLASEAVQPALARVGSPNFVDLDIIFSANVDCDFDPELGGVSLRRFLLNYEDWVNYCGSRRTDDPIQPSGESADQLRHFCLALSLLARRAQSNNSNLAESLFTFHALFKGDFRIDSPADEWVLSDIDILRRVLSPAVHMTLRLLQDYHLGEMYDDNNALYSAIESYETDWVICHETDPKWRVAVLQNRPQLMALRHTAEDGQMDFHVVQMKLDQLRFNLIKLNPESVRGLWAGQQIELIFFRNQNSERGSIQNQTSVLRNMINSSCDDPVGYPAYVSPLLTSFSTRSPLYTRYLGPEWSLRRFFTSVRDCLLACALHCRTVANNPSSCPPPQMQQQQQ
uniref:Pecanex-like protein n=1 Tax=Macrostomum lignano TaxID=282301 RepID=A0A1I8J4S5_9PLAT